MSDRYVLKRLLATGGMAEVYLGASRGEEGFEKPVALKRILPHLARDERFARMFLSEARLATHLHHQNVVSVLDVGRSADGLFIVMELINGWDVSEVLEAAAQQDRWFPPALSAYIAGQALAGLSHAYRKKVDGRPILSAHRDISPSNLLLSTEGEVKVADFGIAKLDALSSGTEAGMFKGKLSYAAPEALRGEPLTHAVDQFSLGVVLYEMVSGQLPFGNPDNLTAFIEAVQSQPARPLPGLDPAFQVLLDRMMAKAVGDRFLTPDALAAAIASYLASAGVPAGPRELTEFLGSLRLPLPIAERAEVPVGIESSSNIPGSSTGSATAEVLPSTVSPVADTEAWWLAPGGQKRAPEANARPIELLSDASSGGASGGLASGASVPSVAPPTGGLRLPPPSVKVRQEGGVGARLLPPTLAGRSSAPFESRDESVPAPVLGAAFEFDPDWVPQGPTMGADGRLEADGSERASTAVPPAPVGGRPLPAPIPADNGPLELARDLSRPAVDEEPSGSAPAYRDTPAEPVSQKGRWVMIVATLLALSAFAVLAIYTKRATLLPSLGIRAGPAATLYIDSDPPGATVRINGKDLGKTPMVQDNRFAEGEIDFQLLLQDYRPFAGKFRGGEDFQSTVKLTPLRRGAANPRP